MDCGWNVSDSELATGAHDGHRVLGYLLFDFFMTDINGDATQQLYLDSSFHVLWRTDLRRPNPARDGKPRTHLVTYDSAVYESSFADENVKVYAEGEPGRPKPGQVTLPPGYYECRLLLTEESFHNVPPDLASQFPWGLTAYPDGGFWAHALSDDQFPFTITGGTPPEGGTMHVASIDMTATKKGPFATVEAAVKIVDADGAPVPEATVSGQWTYPKGSVSATSAATDTNGIAKFKLKRVAASSGDTFTFTVIDVSKDANWTYSPTANVETSDSTTVP